MSHAPALDGVSLADGPALTASALTVSRRRRTLVQGLEVEVAAGETLAVMGRSGAGKTTLLRTIAGLAQPDSGQVHRPAGQVPFVFQDPRLLPWRTVRSNIELVLAPEHRPRARTWLDTVGLADVADSFPMTLSGGMRQRVSIARALACQAPLLLVDEPFAHLDVITARALRHELRDHIAGTRSAVVWVTHDPAEAAEVATRTLVMDGPDAGGSWRIIPHADRPIEEVAATLISALHLDIHR